MTNLKIKRKIIPNPVKNDVNLIFEEGSDFFEHRYKWPLEIVMLPKLAENFRVAIRVSYLLLFCATFGHKATFRNSPGLPSNGEAHRAP